MQRISAQAKTAIVAEGVPLRADLTDVEVTDLVKALHGAPDVTVETTLTLVARAYDYDVERGVEPGIESGYMLRKHHSDPNDLPDVTFKEVVDSLRSLLQLIDGDRSTPAVGGVDPASFALYDSLSESQKASAHSDTGLTLTLADLGPGQKNYALELAQHITVDTKTRTIRRCLQHLTALQDKSAAFRWTTQPARMSFGPHPPGTPPRPAPDFGSPFFVYGIPWDGSLMEFPLNHRFKIGIDGGGTQVSAAAIAKICPVPYRPQSGATPAGSTSVTGTGTDVSQGASLASGIYDPSVPTAQDTLLAPGMMSDKLASTLTLTDLAEALSSKKASGSSPSVGWQIAIDPALAGKPVTVSGRQYAQGDVLIRMAARLYGLEISTAASDNHLIYVTTPKARATHSTSDLQAEIKRAIPPSLLRSFETQIDRVAGTITASASGSESQGSNLTEQQRMSEEKFERDRRSGAAIAVEGCSYFPADRRLLVLGTAAVPTLASPPATIASLGSEPSRLIALMLLTDGPWVEMRDLLGFERPLCLTDPSTLRMQLTCHEHGKRQGMVFKIRSAEASGTPKFEGGAAFSHDAPP